MKNIVKTLSAVLLFLFAACHKEDVKLNNNSVPGTWKLSESYISNGGKGSWEKSNVGLIVEFQADGGLAGNAYPDYATYTIKDGSTIVLSKKDKTEQNYTYELNGGILSMSPAGPIFCIEGCGNRFNKIH